MKEYFICMFELKLRYNVQIQSLMFNLKNEYELKVCIKKKVNIENIHTKVNTQKKNNASERR